LQNGDAKLSFVLIAHSSFVDGREAVVVCVVAQLLLVAHERASSLLTSALSLRV
jgi:hypothetical protein